MALGRHLCSALAGVGFWAGAQVPTAAPEWQVFLELARPGWQGSCACEDSTDHVSRDHFNRSTNLNRIKEIIEALGQLVVLLHSHPGGSGVVLALVAMSLAGLWIWKH